MQLRLGPRSRCACFACGCSHCPPRKQSAVLRCDFKLSVNIVACRGNADVSHYACAMRQCCISHWFRMRFCIYRQNSSLGQISP